MSTAYRDRVAEDLRLAILQVVDGAGSTTNIRILHTELPGVGHIVGADRLRTELAWLSEQGLMDLGGTDGSVFIVATLTERGIDAAHGRITVPGVRRPAPHERR